MSTKTRLVLAAVAAGVATAACAETRFASFTFENDFFAGYDKHYTNGVQAAFLVDLDRTPQWLRNISADPQAVIAVGQRIYTPTNTDLKIPESNDRPYAGWAYVMGDLRTRATPTIDHLTVSAGMVGPASGARQTQNGVHRLLNDGTSQGWDTQVRNRATLMAGYERAWPAIAQTRFGDHHVDLSVRAAANLGTPLTYRATAFAEPRSSAGMTGWASMYGQSHTTRSSSHRPMRVFEGQHGSDRFGQLALSFAF